MVCIKHSSSGNATTRIMQTGHRAVPCTCQVVVWNSHPLPFFLMGRSSLVIKTGLFWGGEGRVMLGFLFFGCVQRGVDVYLIVMRSD